MSTLIAEGLDKSITAKVGGRTVVMNRRQAIAHRMIEMALGGDLKAVAILLKLDPGATGVDLNTATQEQGLSPEEAALLEKFLVDGSGDEGGSP
jgi:hypothetical protein